MGVVRLRLARFGGRNRPFYRLVAIDSRRRRQGRPLEYIGTYDPLPAARDGVKEVRLKVDRIKYWLSVGAQPSDVVAFLFWKSGLMPAPPVRYQPTKATPRAQREFSTCTSAYTPIGSTLYQRNFSLGGMSFTAGTLCGARQSCLSVQTKGSL